MNDLAGITKRIWKRNGATILTCVGGVGVVATAVVTAKVTPKAIVLLNEAEKEKGEKLTKLETFKVAGPVYIPAILTGMATLASIFGANALNKRQQAALVSAYAMLDSSFKEYRQKVDQLYGENSDKNVRTEIAKDKYDNEETIEYEDGKNLFFDQYSGRYFRATNETVLRAEYEINKAISMNGGASLNEYYDLLGIPKTDYGEELGWSAAQMNEIYWDQWLNFWHEKVEMEDGIECWIINMSDPFAGFEEY